MAIVTFGGGITGMRGKLGGNVLSANGTSNFIRVWGKNVAKRNALQSKKRAWLQEINAKWAALTTAKQDAWDALAATPPETDYNSLGEEILLSGFNWHSRINLRRYEAGQAYEDDAPGDGAITPPSGFTLQVYESAYGAGESFFSYTDSIFTGYYAVLKLRKYSSLGRKVATSGFVNVWSGSVEASDHTHIEEELIEVFGATQPDERIFGELYRQRLSGIRSTAVVTNTVVLEEP